MIDLLNEITQVEKEAQCLYTEAQLTDRARQLALEIGEQLVDKNPIVITVLNGGIVFAGHLIPALDFPLELDYLHATRYQGETQGSELSWIAKPQQNLEGRVVLIVDDILDHGATLEAIIAECRSSGASEILSVVLIKKCLEEGKQPNVDADFVGFEIADRYVFGFGMDYKNYLRNAAGLFAVKAP